MARNRIYTKVILVAIFSAGPQNDIIFYIFWYLLNLKNVSPFSVTISYTALYLP